MKTKFLALLGILFPATFVAIIGFGPAVTFSQDETPSFEMPTEPLPAYVEGEVLVTFKTDPSVPDRAEINSLGLNVVNSASRTDLTKAVMEERLQARNRAIEIDPYVLFDTRELRNDRVRARMERLGQVSANSFDDDPSETKMVFAVAKSDDLSTEELIEELQSNPEVADVQPNYIYTISQDGADSENTPNAVDQENAGVLYGIFNNNNGAGVRSDTVWNQGITGKNIIVANIDSGVDVTHEDLRGNIWRNPGETNCTNNVDDDLNGFVDDCVGWDFGDNDNNPINNGFAHGTHTAGTIAARRDASGVVGVAPDAKIMALKVFRANRSATSLAIANAINYAWQNGAQVINMSLGAPATGCPTVEHDVIQKAYAGGVFMIASSGNDGPNSPQSPAICQYVLTVGATDAAKRVTVYSGSYQDMVDGVGPGHKIISTYPNNSYAEQSGTSMAAPHVAGIAALMLEKNPTIKPLEIAETLCDTAEDIPPAGFDERAGCGFFSAQKALAAVQGGVTERDCHLITNDASMPDTDIFGVPYNVNSPQRENLINVRCGVDDVRASIGQSQNKLYIYSRGYAYVNNDWVPVNYTGQKPLGNAWFEDSATTNLTAVSTPGQIGYLLSFLCMTVNGEMRCGCRENGVCAGNVWNLQAYQP